MFPSSIHSMPATIVGTALVVVVVVAAVPSKNHSLPPIVAPA